MVCSFESGTDLLSRQLSGSADPPDNLHAEVRGHPPSAKAAVLCKLSHPSSLLLSLRWVSLFLHILTRNKLNQEAPFTVLTDFNHFLSRPTCQIYDHLSYRASRNSLFSLDDCFFFFFFREVCSGFNHKKTHFLLQFTACPHRHWFNRLESCHVNRDEQILKPCIDNKGDVSQERIEEEQTLVNLNLKLLLLRRLTWKYNNQASEYKTQKILKRQKKDINQYPPTKTL